jgi:ABC-type uncharacterized transport system involved in gliding motility auxiliary subunit
VVLTAFLATALFLALSQFAARHFDLRVDLSEDQLSGWSPAAERVLERLDDTLSVELFVTGRPELSAAQLHRRRVLERFDELAASARGKVALVVSDPTDSYPDRLRAQRLGLSSVPVEDFSGTSRVSQDVWFAAVLRYRGREETIGFLHPLTLEYDVAAAVANLTAERRARLGWMVGDVPGDAGAPSAPDSGFRALRRHLEQRFDVVEVFGLASGVALPADLDALVCLAPRELAPRAVFEIEEFVRAGGGLLVLSDRSRAVDAARRIETYATGLEPLFAAWGVPQAVEAVWDRVQATPLVVTRAAEGRVGADQATVAYPLWPSIRAAGLDQDSPITARLRLLPLRWAHPFEAGAAVDGVVRASLARSSDESFVLPLSPEIRVDGASIDALTRELTVRFEPQAYDLAVRLEGRFPTAFTGPVSPLAVDHATGAEVPGTERLARAEPAQTARVVLVGDSDFARDEVVALREGGLSQPGRVAALLLENAVDWLTLGEDLAALRMRSPRDRSLVDFDARAALAEGVEQAEHLSGITAAAQRAKARAAAERRSHTLASFSGSLVLVALLAGVSIVRRRRAPLVDLPHRGGTP